MKHNQTKQKMANSNSYGFLSGIASMPFFPNSLVEWLILFLVLIILVLIVRQVYSIFDEKKRQKTARSEAEKHMQGLRDRMNENENATENMYGQPYGQNAYRTNPLGQNGVSYPSGARTGASHYGQNGFGPKGEPVYGPAQAEQKGADTTGRRDQQGNGFSKNSVKNNIPDDLPDYRTPREDTVPERTNDRASKNKPDSKATEDREKTQDQARHPQTALTPVMPPAPQYPFQGQEQGMYGQAPYGWPMMPPMYPPMYGYGMYGWPMAPGMYPQAPYQGPQNGSQQYQMPGSPFMGGYPQPPMYGQMWNYPQSQEGEQGQKRKDTNGQNGYSNGNFTR